MRSKLNLKFLLSIKKMMKKLKEKGFKKMMKKLKKKERMSN